MTDTHKFARQLLPESFEGSGASLGGQPSLERQCQHSAVRLLCELSAVAAGRRYLELGGVALGTALWRVVRRGWNEAVGAVDPGASMASGPLAAAQRRHSAVSAQRAPGGAGGEQEASYQHWDNVMRWALVAVQRLSLHEGLVRALVDDFVVSETAYMLSSLAGDMSTGDARAGSAGLLSYLSALEFNLCVTTFSNADFVAAFAGLYGQGAGAAPTRPVGYYAAGFDGTGATADLVQCLLGALESQAVVDPPSSLQDWTGLVPIEVRVSLCVAFVLVQGHCAKC